ncbi:Uncharacterised protein [Sphingobacterium spiritivorum]|uniref:Uncharacterized protein n=2 Tax=Sphingobacterium spiritivorum TaxID=258 RepID=D7VJG3_SPHSI|nr:hypothetical protein HMPREF0766_11132 [Sphingobacterium spiritivorum ATCC 33861]QQT36875.1 hypothetical protein I6J01_05465 [Sphingobacterium spiritivorum]SUJ25523.1 Uncharacterised protein [Sphingobacterium spiritivorum]
MFINNGLPGFIREGFFNKYSLHCNTYQLLIIMENQTYLKEREIRKSKVVFWVSVAILIFFASTVFVYGSLLYLPEWIIVLHSIADQLVRIPAILACFVLLGISGYYILFKRQYYYRWYFNVLYNIFSIALIFFGDYFMI